MRQLVRREVDRIDEEERAGVFRDRCDAAEIIHGSDRVRRAADRDQLGLRVHERSQVGVVELRGLRNHPRHAHGHVAIDLERAAAVGGTIWHLKTVLSA